MGPLFSPSSFRDDDRRGLPRRRLRRCLLRHLLRTSFCRRRTSALTGASRLDACCAMTPLRLLGVVVLGFLAFAGLIEGRGA